MSRLFVPVIICLSFLLAGCSAKTNQSALPTNNFSKGAQIAKIPAEALKNALNSFTKAKEGGQDLKNGPCLGKIADDWVLDIAHNPRLPVDDLDENQCPDLKQGSAHHFIEMDASGQIIQAH
ncbi:hypothetical protein HY024_00220 [Candidatus Curtissbacteria bacterium]|nr:hypothetical protein [Candidatus Curtissbacteria bacterium]